MSCPRDSLHNSGLPGGVPSPPGHTHPSVGYPVERFPVAVAPPAGYPPEGWVWANGTEEPGGRGYPAEGEGAE